MSAAEHLAEAERQEREAARLDEQPRGPGRGDVRPQVAAVNDATSTGGEPLVRPRWTWSLAPTLQSRGEADRLRKQAAEHRRMAGTLAGAEQRACQGLHPDDIDHGPFFHRRDIAQVVPIEQKGAIVGARIEFRPVPDLTADWMRRTVECTRTRLETLGFPADYMADSPLAVPGAMATVQQHGDQVVVIVTGRDTRAATEVARRARALVLRGQAAPQGQINSSRGRAEHSARSA